MKDPLPEDRERMLAQTGGLWEALRGKSVLITGGTGFYGCWLLEALLAAADARSLDCRAAVVTRDAAAFRARRPHLAGNRIVSLLEAPPRERFSYILHAAPTGAEALPPSAERLLLASSGAVYGSGPFNEDSTPTPENDYGKEKLAAERLRPEAVYARGFAFLGPYLPLDGAFAAGNFVADALRGGPLRVKGDGKAERSYLYGSDLAVWLWTLLLKGRPGRAYNVGSEKPITILQLARSAGPGLEVIVEGGPAPGLGSRRYVPSTRRAREELGLSETVGLSEGLARMAAWNRLYR